MWGLPPRHTGLVFHYGQARGVGDKPTTFQSVTGQSATELPPPPKCAGRGGGAAHSVGVGLRGAGGGEDGHSSNSSMQYRRCSNVSGIWGAASTAQPSIALHKVLRCLGAVSASTAFQQHPTAAVAASAAARALACTSCMGCGGGCEGWAADARFTAATTAAAATAALLSCPYCR